MAQTHKLQQELQATMKFVESARVDDTHIRLASGLIRRWEAASGELTMELLQALLSDVQSGPFNAEAKEKLEVHLSGAVEKLLMGEEVPQRLRHLISNDFFDRS